MTYRFSAEQVMLRDMARKLSEKEFLPKAKEVDASQRFPLESLSMLAENGLLGIQIPETYGGAGAGLLSLVLAIEQIARCCASTSVILSTQALASEPLLLGGTEEQKKKYLVRLAEGKCLGACAITEPCAGSDVGAMRTTAKKVKGGYLINGSKIFITNGGVAEIVTVLAYTDRGKGPRGGISMFIVEAGQKGFFAGKHEEKLGIRGSDTRELVFEDCFVPEENRLGPEGAGFKMLMKTFNNTRPVVGAQALGIAQGALEQAIAYSKERIQFGKPLAGNQGIQWMLAEMALKVEASRSLVYRAASLIDDDPGSAEIPIFSSMAKWHASDAAMSVTTDAVQLFGGYGYTKEYPVERMMRDAKITQIYEGTNQVQRTIVSSFLLRD